MALNIKDPETGPLRHPAYPNLPAPIQTVESFNQNLGDLRTSGIDVDMEWRSQATSIGRFSFGSNGTYLIDWKIEPDGLNYVSGVGQNCLACIGPLPRWKNDATRGWQYVARDPCPDLSIRLRRREFFPPSFGDDATTTGFELRSVGRARSLHGIQKYDRCARHQEPDESRAAIHQSAVHSASWLRSDVRRSAWTRLLRAADLQFQVERRVKSTNGAHSARAKLATGRAQF